MPEVRLSNVCEPLARPCWQIPLKIHLPPIRTGGGAQTQPVTATAPHGAQPVPATAPRGGQAQPIPATAPRVTQGRMVPARAVGNPQNVLLSAAVALRNILLRL